MSAECDKCGNDLWWINDVLACPVCKERDRYERLEAKYNRLIETGKAFYDVAESLCASPAESEPRCSERPEGEAFWDALQDA